MQKKGNLKAETPFDNGASLIHLSNLATNALLKRTGFELIRVECLKFIFIRSQIETFDVIRPWQIRAQFTWGVWVDEYIDVNNATKAKHQRHDLLANLSTKRKPSPSSLVMSSMTSPDRIIMINCLTISR